jgi:hypothetical protein
VVPGASGGDGIGGASEASFVVAPGQLQEVPVGLSFRLVERSAHVRIPHLGKPNALLTGELLHFVDRCEHIERSDLSHPLVGPPKKVEGTAA